VCRAEKKAKGVLKVNIRSSWIPRIFSLPSHQARPYLLLYCGKSDRFNLCRGEAWKI
jgi:hypothetical protein